MVIVQLEPVAGAGIKLAGQELLLEAKVPTGGVTPMGPSASGVVPVFVNVTVFAALIVSIV